MHTYPIDYKNIGWSTEYYKEVISEHETAVNYLTSHYWCKQILNASVYLNLGSKICVFLFEIENIASKPDNFLWVIVGDLPAMYLDIHGPKSIIQALEDYVTLAGDWIKNVRSGQSVKDCYPFIADATIEMAELLERRTVFIKNVLVPNIEDIRLTNFRYQ